MLMMKLIDMNHDTIFIHYNLFHWLITHTKHIDKIVDDEIFNLDYVLAVDFQTFKFRIGQ